MQYYYLEGGKGGCCHWMIPLLLPLWCVDAFVLSMDPLRMKWKEVSSPSAPAEKGDGGVVGTGEASPDAAPSVGHLADVEADVAADGMPD